MLDSRIKSYGWLVDKLKSGDFQSNFFGHRYGTDCQPTGTGKASEQIIDCASMIKHAGSRRMVFNLASHRLALSYQLAGNMIFCLKEAGYINANNACITINSSDDADKYNEDLAMKDFRIVKSVKELDDVNMQFMFVISCYKSHPKIEKYLENHFADALKVSYWDEAHLVSVTDTEVESNVNVGKSIKLFDRVLAFSATPKDEVTIALEKREEEVNPVFHVGVNFRHYLKHITIKEAIKARTILPVSFRSISTSTLATSVDKGKLCLKVLSHLKNECSGLNQKVLISVDRKEEVKELEDFFKSHGKMTFATTSKFGFESTDEALNTSLQNGSIKDFTDTIRNYQGDCFVIHIRQLIEGIDIDCLTATVIFDCPNENNKVTLIQTIGRILRFYHNPKLNCSERGMPIEDRVKKFGYVYWAIEDANFESWVEKIGEFYIKSYDCGDCEFKVASHGKKNNSGNGGDSIDLNSSMWNGLDDLFNSVGGKDYNISPVYLRTIDALIQFLPYKRIIVPSSMQLGQLKKLIEDRIEKSVKEEYTTEEWSISSNEIERAKELMINKEPKLEELFKAFEIMNKPED